MGNLSLKTWVNPTGSFTIWELEDQERRRTDFAAQKLWKGRSGIDAMGDDTETTSPSPEIWQPAMPSKNKTLPSL